MKKKWDFYTGGTIGMVQGEHGLRPDTALADQQTLVDEFLNRTPRRRPCSRR